jgi:tetratricopeptide (TPR) repeat protein
VQRCRHFSLRLMCALVVCAASLACEGDVDETPKSRAEAPPKLLENLGGQEHPISTNSALAQRYFNQGMILTFGFNHEAAIRSFEEAARIDPTCAMCRWGIALALGPNINAPMGPEAGGRAFREAQRAMGLREHASPRERAYIEALALRYADPQPQNRAELDLAYSGAMRELFRADPNDYDAAVLFAESLMDLYPWAYWTAEQEPREYTRELLDVLEGVLAGSPEHLGANHYYIHAVEEYFPEKGVPSAERLGSLAPDAGHLVHMPSHIYWRVGRYGDAAEINQRAVKADEQYFAWCRPGAFYAAAYYPHNVHFLWASASFEGQAELALITARKLAQVTGGSVDEVPFVQEFMAIPMLTLARFGRWDSLLAEPEPAPEHVYLVGIWHYTRGLAFVRSGQQGDARAELAGLDTAAAREEAATLLLAGLTSSARQLLEIGAAHLEGEIAAGDGDPETAIAALRLAVDRHQSLVYMEPPPWYAPPRLALGALLLAQDRAEEAEAVYRADLAQYPKNGWALFGLAQSFADQGEEAKAEYARVGFENAWANADVTLERSEF